MTEIYFYHVQNQPLERVLPTLLEESLERGWRVVVQAASEGRIEALDGICGPSRRFLPAAWHAQAAGTTEQPIVFTVNNNNPNKSEVRFLIDNARFRTIVAVCADRVVVRQRRRDVTARARAGEAKEKGLDPTYRRPDPRAVGLKRPDFAGSRALSR